MVGKIDDFMRFHEAALSIRGQRQQLLASNIANADTPNYKARDIDFSAAMNHALSLKGGQVSADLAKTSATHLDVQGAQNGVSPLYRTISQGSVDGNTVDMDVERNQFTDNSLRYEASLTLLNMQIRNMLAAIQG
ncbi:MAG: flagellar basal body rod protein FlgB [Undibacterium sp.]|uniref:flagellar basal body rod protein FlgB n=1 Tax=Undibacterium sp. TaxID=1914977 RepID=UPI002716F6EF|nr:flagellar basal body rod protein FlgB [Undibacterium sp.]MDO8653698.1 flagellar basal body rod protein FlgB [Undibacterium sp.]